MATTWTVPKIPPPWGETIRAALAICTTGTEIPTVPVTDGLDLRGLTAVQASVETASKASGTIDIVGLKAGDTVTVGGVVFTAITPSQSGALTAVQFKAGSDYNPDHGDDWITAANLAAAILANGVGATVSAFVTDDIPRVTVVALADGAAGNAIALATSSARAVLSGATLANGAAAGAIGAGASLKAYLLNPATQRWNPAPDLDVALVQGNAAQTLQALPIKAQSGRLQMVPNNVGAPCFVFLNGLGGRIP